MGEFTVTSPPQSLLSAISDALSAILALLSAMFGVLSAILALLSAMFTGVDGNNCRVMDRTGKVT
ncbi:hypothetical protein [Lysinibacillus sp. NPDC096212]|uniref:hypothetical protein n=1 Tax=Lysinibacillus sp. NPDC096212 TaxID=3364135 RepID=UPI00380C1C04